MHVHPRQLLQSHTHSLLQSHIGMANQALTATRQSRSTRTQAGYTTLSSGAVDDDEPGIQRDRAREGEAPPGPRAKNPYPYPKHPNPTPHQIFHLPPNASQAQIKARYYELVRAHHPDSQHAAGISASLAHARFRTIKASYDFLAGKTLSPHPNARPAPSPQNFDPYMHELARRRRAYYAAQGRYQAGDEDGEGAQYHRPRYPDDGYDQSGKKERLILAFGVFAVLAGLFPTLPGDLISTLVPPTTVVPPNTSAPSSTSANIPTSSSNANKGSTSAPNPPTTTPTATAATSATGGSSFLFVDLDKGHREAVSALVEVRNERETLGVERREGVRRRVKEMNGTAEVEAEAPPSDAGSDLVRASEPPSSVRQGVSVDCVEDADVTVQTRDKNMEAEAARPSRDKAGSSRIDEGGQ